MRYANAALSLLTICLAGVAGCRNQEINISTPAGRINVGAGHGEDQEVNISTPAGRINVETNQTDANDLGLPAYPGSQISSNDNDKSANVDLGFGHWQLRVKVVKYRSTDPPQKVLAFYRKALGVYGDVIECRGDKPVSAPATTHEGLSCSTSGRGQKQIHLDATDLELKAGSPEHQHLVAFENGAGPGSDFVMVALDLPQVSGDGRRETN